MVFKTHYLLIMAFMLLLLNTVNTTGEYILGSIVRERPPWAQVGRRRSSADRERHWLLLLRPTSVT